MEVAPGTTPGQIALTVSVELPDNAIHPTAGHDSCHHISSATRDGG